jgi:hypothetical protein
MWLQIHVRSTPDSRHDSDGPEQIAPVLLKNEGRIEALFTLYFLALLVQAIIERELRLAMKREKIDELPLYPEQRDCARPTTEQVLRLFSLAERPHKELRCTSSAATLVIASRRRLGGTRLMIVGVPSPGPRRERARRPGRGC